MTRTTRARGTHFRRTLVAATAAIAAGGGSALAAGMSTGDGAVATVELLLPAMDPARGRHLFASKGCVVCHSINGVGGTDAPKLDYAGMGKPMNPFEFAARMWRGAPAMIAMQNQELGHQIEFSGQELADIIAFAHSPAEQKRFSEKDIPKDIREHMEED